MVTTHVSIDNSVQVICLWRQQFWQE